MTTHHAEEAVIDRMMVSAAKRPVIAADSSKLGRAGFSRVCECKKGLTLVTNRDADENNQIPLITINSWNEWTETSYLEPDTVYGYGYMEAIKRVFL